MNTILVLQSILCVHGSEDSDDEKEDFQPLSIMVTMQRVKNERSISGDIEKEKALPFPVSLSHGAPVTVQIEPTSPKPTPSFSPQPSSSYVLPIMRQSSEDENNSTTVDLDDEVSNAELDFLPKKSREIYLKAYSLFNEWRLAKGVKSYSENVMLAYFTELSTTKQPTSLWTIYSMLKATLKSKREVHLESYKTLLDFLKKNSKGHTSKKSKIFTALEIEKFLNEAPDCHYLATKVVLIFGINGACRIKELLNLRVNDIEKHSNKLLLIKLPNTTTKIDRSFVIREEHVNVVEKYLALRPTKTKIDRFFLQFRNGKCVNQPMGINKLGALPREVANFLQLPDPQLYTGHCFRKTSGTLMANSGADLTSLLKRHGEVKSAASAEAEGHIDDSIVDKSKIYKRNL